MTATINEAASTDVGLQAYLEADETLMDMLSGGVYSTYLRKAGDHFPLVRFFLVEQSDLMNVWGGRVWTELVYQVEGIDKGYEVDDLRAIANRLDTLLHLKRGLTWDDVLVEEVYRREPLFRRELEVDQPYAFAGGEYIFHVSLAPEVEEVFIPETDLYGEGPYGEGDFG